MRKGGSKGGGRGKGIAGTKAAPIARPSYGYDYKVACREYGLGDEKAARDAQRAREAEDRQRAREAGVKVDLGRGEQAWVAAATGKPAPPAAGGKGRPAPKGGGYGYSGNACTGGAGGSYNNAPVRSSAGDLWGAWRPSTAAPMTPARANVGSSGGAGGPASARQGWDSSANWQGQEWNGAWQQVQWQQWATNGSSNHWQAAAGQPTMAAAAATPAVGAVAQVIAAAPVFATALPAAPPPAAPAGPPLELDARREGLTDGMLEELRQRRREGALAGAVLRLPAPEEMNLESFWRVLELACTAHPRPGLVLQLGGAADLGPLSVVVAEAERRGLKAVQIFRPPSFLDEPAAEAGDADVVLVLTQQLQ